jgi:hypothetical protein
MGQVYGTQNLLKIKHLQRPFHGASVETLIYFMSRTTPVVPLAIASQPQCC